MRLNQYKPGLDYKLISQTGPVHEPVFTMTVELNKKTYEATGPSKKAAKVNVAIKARRGFTLSKAHLPQTGARKGRKSSKVNLPYFHDHMVRINVSDFLQNMRHALQCSALTVLFFFPFFFGRWIT